MLEGLQEGVLLKYEQETPGSVVDELGAVCWWSDRVTGAPGTKAILGGIDIWRARDGKSAEYRVRSGGLHLMAQLNPGDSA